MTITQAIERAIEGGWDAEKPLNIAFFESAPRSVRALALTKREYIYAILLDPKFWQAVGKTEGWKTTTKVNGYPVWHWNMHRMIDALAEGRSIEEFLATL